MVTEKDERNILLEMLRNRVLQISQNNLYTEQHEFIEEHIEEIVFLNAQGTHAILVTGYGVSSQATDITVEIGDDVALPASTVLKALNAYVRHAHIKPVTITRNREMYKAQGSPGSTNTGISVDLSVRHEGVADVRLKYSSFGKLTMNLCLLNVKIHDIDRAIAKLYRCQLNMIGD